MNKKRSVPPLPPFEERRAALSLSVPPRPHPHSHSGRSRARARCTSFFFFFFSEQTGDKFTNVNYGSLFLRESHLRQRCASRPTN